MKATLLLRQRLILNANAFVEMVVWQVPKPLPRSAHDFKYRLALVSDGYCVLRYDNEAGKGDHKHLGSLQVPFHFKGLEQLQADFWADVESWLEEQ